MKTSIYQSLIKTGSSSPYRRASLPPCTPAGAFPACASPLRRLVPRTLPLLLLLLLPWFPAPTHAQDITPGTEAQGYLKEKHGTVDHATGMFHYSIPLFTVTSGSYSLPVSLDYTASGVRFDAKPGVIGHGWNLQAGGVVTRTLRGGMSDEQIGGFVRDEWVPELDILTANTHERDGESDIFTAAFNGRSVRFILKREGNRYIACPLEKTNVRIVCESNHSNTIEGWVVTDESGIRYIYREVEWTTNLFYEAYVSFNSIDGSSHISSWYLSRIEIPGCHPICFTYLPAKENRVRYLKNTRSNYIYGRAMTEVVMNFERFQAAYTDALAKAQQYLQEESLLLEIYDCMLKVDAYTNPILPLPESSAFDEACRFNKQIIGILSEIGKVSQIGDQMIEYLDQIAASVTNNDASRAIQNARNILVNCLQETKLTFSKQQQTCTSYQILSPLLTHIHSRQQEVVLHYGREGGYGKQQLQRLDLNDYNGVASKHVELTVSPQYLLKAVVWKDKNQQVTDRQAFTYFREQEEEIPPAADYWGYYGPNYEAYPDMVAPPGLRKKYTLRQIEYATGGGVTIEYEQNEYTTDFRGSVSSFPYAGLRTREIVLQDRFAHNDTIRYHYPLSGISIYPRIEMVDTLFYGSFIDRIIHPEMVRQGFVLFETGNNGLFYPYVQEEMVGKGSNTYLFFTPDTRMYTPDNGVLIPFWVYGLPLAQAT